MSEQKLKKCPCCASVVSLNVIEPHSHSPALQAIMPGLPDHPGSWYIECGCGYGLIDDDRNNLIRRHNTRPIEGKLLEALEECIDLAWVDTTEVRFDDSMVFSHSYDFDGWESLRKEIHTSEGSYAVWPNQLGGTKKWSAYGGPNGSLWFERFDAEQEAKDCVMDHLAQSIPDHPAIKARQAIAEVKS